MRLKMHERSLFATLLRQPWWVSVLLALVVGLLVRLTLSGDYMIYGMTALLPFLGIGMIALVKQLRAPSATRVAATLAAVQALTWRDFSAALEAAFARDGYGVTRLDLPAADFEITKAGRVTLVCAKRWKAASHGIAPLQDLAALCKARDAAEAMYVSSGALTENAQRFASAQETRLVNGVSLAELLRDMAPPAKV